MESVDEDKEPICTRIPVEYCVNGYFTEKWEDVLKPLEAHGIKYCYTTDFDSHGWETVSMAVSGVRDVRTMSIQIVPLLREPWITLSERDNFKRNPESCRDSQREDR